MLKNSSHLSSAVQGSRGLHSPFDGLGGSQKLVQSSQSCLIQTIPLLSVHRISVSPQYTHFFCHGGTPQRWAAAHLRIPPGSGVLPFPDVGVWRRVLYGRHSLATFCTKRDIFAINVCPCWLSAYGKVQKRLDIFRDSRITQNIIPNMNALQEGCPAPCSRIGLVWPGVHRQLVIQGKTSNISTSLLKFIQISNYLVLVKGWKSWDGGKRQRGRTGERHAVDDQILQATYVIQEAYHLPPSLSSKSLLPFPVGQHWIDCLCGQASAERLETPQAKHAWVRTSDYTVGYVEAVDMPGSHLPISFRAQTHRLLPISKKALREGRGYLLLNGTGAGQGIRRLRVWLFLRWDLAHSPDSRTEVGVTAGPPPLAHHRFTVGSKSAGKSQYALDFKTLPRRGKKKKKYLSDPALGLASPDWLGQSQPLGRRKYTPLTAAVEPNPRLVWHCVFNGAVLIYSSLVSDLLLGSNSMWREWGS